MGKPERIQPLPVQPVRRIRPPYSLRAKLADGTRGRVTGNSFMDCMRTAARMGVTEVIDGQGHKWENTGDGIFNSVGVVTKRVHR